MYIKLVFFSMKRDGKQNKIVYVSNPKTLNFKTNSSKANKSVQARYWLGYKLRNIETGLEREFIPSYNVICEKLTINAEFGCNFFQRKNG